MRQLVTQMINGPKLKLKYAPKSFFVLASVIEFIFLLAGKLTKTMLIWIQYQVHVCYTRGKIKM